MANPQKENGNTQIANEIIEALIKSAINGTEMAIVLFILRKTYGWNKKEDEISISQFCGAIPATKQTICTALNNLQLVKIIRLVKKGNSKKMANLWAFNKNYDEWQLVKKYRLVKFSPPTSQVSSNQLVKKPLHTKDNIQKTIQKTTTTIPPFSAVVDFYEKNIGLITPYTADLIKSLIEEHTEANVLKALKIAVESGKRQINYVRGILNNEKGNMYSWEKRVSKDEEPMIAKLPLAIKREVQRMIDQYQKNLGEYPKQKNIELMIKKITHE